jgi:hypothetical protein
VRCRSRISATRSAAEAFLVELFESDPTSSTLVGVDFSLGYPAGTATALGLTGTAWSAMWALLAEEIRRRRPQRQQPLRRRCGAQPVD